MKYDKILSEINTLPLSEKVNAINELRAAIHEISPFKNEPVDFVEWVKNDDVKANDYNPNQVAPPEMELLRISINNDGYTQPVVTMKDGEEREVIDGFHRNRVGKECKDITLRVKGYLPVVNIRDSQKGRKDRIASTIRHNRARGKHTVDSMSDIVLELKSRNWKNSRISRELGMDEDEILRLCQITGLADLFSDDDFSRSWDIENAEQSDFVPLDDNVGEDEAEVRTVNTSDDSRIFHTWDKWECHKAGFYATTMDGMKKDECERAYAEFLSDTDRFSAALKHIISEWKNSCEHYLTNASMNRIAWLGQAAMCYATGVPSKFCGGFNLLSEKQQNKADNTALIYLNKYLESHGMETVTLEDGLTSRQSTIY